MLTTIQIRKSALRRLTRFRRRPKETYEDIIIRLMARAELERQNEQQLLQEGYEEMAGDARKINREWETADTHWD